MIESASTGTIFGQVSDRLVVSRQKTTSGRALRTTEIHVNDKAGNPMRHENTTSQSITVDAPNGGASDRLASDAAERKRSMIRCIPRGICSWNFLLDGAGHQGTLELGWMGEQGAITVDDIAFEVQKHGV
jgi:hypothetical protein